ncbi:unnamed protein product, partial [marine sediment metagenome]
AHSPVGGDITLWKRQDRGNISRYMRIKKEPIFLIPKIYA